MRGNHHSRRGSSNYKGCTKCGSYVCRCAKDTPKAVKGADATVSPSQSPAPAPASPASPGPVVDKKWDFSQGMQKSAYPDRLKFTPYAFAKMLYMKDKGSTEVSGFALTDENDPYLVIDFLMPEQECSGATTEMTAKGIVDLFDKVSGPAKFGGLGISPSRFGRIWIHTHPGFSSEPSGTDWSTFRETFGGKDWSIMFILSAKKIATCILQIDVVPNSYFRIPWEVEWDYEFAASNFKAWDEEYKKKVEAHHWSNSAYYSSPGTKHCEKCGNTCYYEYDVLGMKVCWMCKRDMPEPDPKYAKWNELMVEKEDSIITTDMSGGFADDTTVAKDDKVVEVYANSGFADEDDDVSPKPDTCDHCGAKATELYETDSLWLCDACLAIGVGDDSSDDDDSDFSGDVDDLVIDDDDRLVRQDRDDPMAPPDVFGRY